MSKEQPKEEKRNEKMLELNYSNTKFCPVCNLRLPIDERCGCGSPICS
jgi:hypothetical protein